jgi:isochorismate synthase
MNKEKLFSTVQNHFESELPFVIYRKPNKEIIRGVFQEDDNLYITSAFKENGFVFSPFDTDLNAILFPLEKSKKMSAFYVLTDFESVEKKNVSELTPENELLKNQHVQLVQKGVDSIQNNELKKVVLSRKEEVKIKEITNGTDLINLFERLIGKYPAAFVYCWYHPSVGLWFGATPESLFSLEKKTFRTMALAGTQKFEEDAKVTWSEKEKEEQNLVTDFLENALEKIVPILMVSKPATVKAGNVIHLKTEVGGTINTRLCDIPCLIKRLHPTPAVCGLPKDKAMSFIKENEMYDREFYTGFLGELNYDDEAFEKKGGSKEGYADFYVNLRCMKINKDIATLFVGGGITRDSYPEDEWKETVDKTSTMLQILY